ncbi:MAG: peroxiredoxin [Phycisphaerales bacterium]
MPIEIGRKAPAFTLTNADGVKQSLSDFLGWRVVYFYPKADTPGCTTEACQFTEALKDFEKLNAVVIGISPDEPPALAGFRDKYKLKVTLLGDPRKDVLKKYDAWGEKNMYGKITEGVIRSTVIVDPDGNIAHHWKKVKAEGHAAHVKKKLQELAE